MYPSPRALDKLIEYSGFDSLHYLAVRTFDCPIALGMGHGSITQLGTQFVAKFLKFCTRKLFTIVCDYSTWDSKPSDHASHHEPFCCFRCNPSYRFGFNPFCERINSHKKRNSKPPGALGNGPRMSRPQVAKGQDRGIVCNA